MTTEPKSSVDEPKAIAVLTLAFATDPAGRWAWPDSHQYLESFPGFASAFGGAAFAQRTAYCASGYVAASLWLPPGVEPDEQTMVEVVQQTVAQQTQEEVFAVFEQMAGFHPAEPHWYLPLIGVDPAHQGQGHGSDLMRQALAACDRDGVPAYLESSNPRNIPFYERLGFEALGKIQSGKSPTLVPMVRKPR